VAAPLLLMIGGFILATPGGGILPISQWQMMMIALAILVPTLVVTFTLVQRNPLVPTKISAR
jgi:hypothetical protein